MAPSGFVKDVADWVSDNKVAAAGIAAVAVVGGGYVLYRINTSNKDATPSTTSTSTTSTSTTSVSSEPKSTTLSDDGVKLKEQGNAAFKKKDYQQARELYTRAIQAAGVASEEKSKMYNNRGLCCMRMNELDGAILDFNAALKINPKYVKCIKHRLTYFEKIGDERGQLLDVMKLAVLKSDEEANQAKVQTLLGRLATREAEAAMKRKQPALPSDSVLIPFFDGFGMMFARDGDSVSSLNDKIQASPNDPDLLYARSLAKLDAKDYDTIYDDLTEAVKLYLDNDATAAGLTEALSLKGLFEHLRGNTDEALKCFDEILKDHADHYQTYLHRAIVLTDQEVSSSFAKGKADLQKASEMSSSNPGIKFFQAQVALSQRDIPSALKLIQEAIDCGHKGFMPYLLQATVTQKPLSELMQVMERLEKQHPNEVTCIVYKAQILIQHQQFDKAMSEIEKAMKKHKNNSHIYLNKGVLLLQSTATLQQRGGAQMREIIDEAVKMLEKAVELDPKNEMAHNHLASIAQQQQNYTAAASHYDKTIACSRSIRDVTASCKLKEVVLAQKRGSEEGFTQWI